MKLPTGMSRSIIVALSCSTPQRYLVADSSRSSQISPGENRHARDDDPQAHQDGHDSSVPEPTSFALAGGLLGEASAFENTEDTDEDRGNRY
jgi:hypothetical protein